MAPRITVHRDPKPRIVFANESGRLLLEMGGDRRKRKKRPTVQPQRKIESIDAINDAAQAVMRFVAESQSLVAQWGDETALNLDLYDRRAWLPRPGVAPANNSGIVLKIMRTSYVRGDEEPFSELVFAPHIVLVNSSEPVRDWLEIRATFGGDVDAFVRWLAQCVGADKTKNAADTR